MDGCVQCHVTFIITIIIFIFGNHSCAHEAVISSLVVPFSLETIIGIGHVKENFFNSGLRKSSCLGEYWGYAVPWPSWLQSLHQPARNELERLSGAVRTHKPALRCWPAGYLKEAACRSMHANSVLHICSVIYRKTFCEVSISSIDRWFPPLKCMISEMKIGSRKWIPWNFTISLNSGLSQS